MSAPEMSASAAGGLIPTNVRSLRVAVVSAPQMSASAVGGLTLANDLRLRIENVCARRKKYIHDISAPVAQSSRSRVSVISYPCRSRGREPI